MRWSERQLAMLEAMGVRLWLPSQRPVAVAAVAGRGEAAVERRPAEAAVEGSGAAQREATDGLRGAGLASGDAGSTRFAEGLALAGDVPPAATPDRPVAAPSPATPSVVAAMDWTALRETVAGCTACRLSESRRQTVFGVGHLAAHWMVIGEAPGEQEDIEGEPFVGKSGELLDNMLRAIGLSRSAPDGGADGDPARQVYIANTLKCRPPGNRNPAPDELAQCEAYLVRQVELVRPRIILAMGRFAVQALLKSSEPVGRLRGKVHRWHGVPLVVTYHPAYLLRNLEDKARAWDDLCLAVEAAAGVETAGRSEN